MSTRNPSNNSALQVLLELQDANMGNLTVNGMVDLAQRNPGLLKEIAERIDARGYTNASITFSKLTVDQRLMRLSPDALKVLILLGSNASQSGMVSIKLDTLAKAIDYSVKRARGSLQELIDCRALCVAAKSRRHDAPVYQVNPDLMSVGKSKLTKVRADQFVLRSGAGQIGDRYILAGDLSLVLRKEGIHRDFDDGTSLTFNRLTLESIQKEPSSNNGTDSSATNTHATISEPDGQETLGEFQSYARWS